MDADERIEVTEWIRANIRRGRKRTHPAVSTYGVKHWIEREIGIYMDEGQCADVLMDCGIVVQDGRVGIYNEDFKAIGQRVYSA